MPAAQRTKATFSGPKACSGITSIPSSTPPLPVLGGRADRRLHLILRVHLPQLHQGRAAFVAEGGVTRPGQIAAGMCPARSGHVRRRTMPSSTKISSPPPWLWWLTELPGAQRTTLVARAHFTADATEHLALDSRQQRWVRRHGAGVEDRPLVEVSIEGDRRLLVAADMARVGWGRERMGGEEGRWTAAYTAGPVLLFEPVTG